MNPEKLTLLKRIVVVICVGAVLLSGAFQVGWTMSKTAVRLEAVKGGHARHVIVDDLGHTQFEWLEKNDVAPAAKPPVK